MIIFEEVMICIIVTIFPVLLYLFYVAYKKNLDQKENKLFLNLSLFISLFLSLYLILYFDNIYYYILLTIPLLYGYLYKEKLTIILISIIVGIVFYKEIGLNIFIILATNILYIISYYLYCKTKENNMFLIISFGLITSLISLIYFIFLNQEFNILFLQYILLIAVYFLILFLIDCLIIKAEEIINMYMTIKEFEHSKQIKTSLFKITHEIKNPITVCKGYLDMFNFDNPEKSEKYLMIIKEEMNRTLNLLSDFMDFTKIKIEKQIVDFNTILEDLNLIISPLLLTNNVNYNVSSEKNLFVMADYNRIKQVMINLIKNSVESFEKAGSIKITSYRDQSKLNIFIKDNGSGMDSETLEKIQKGFYTTKPTGTGLGVALSKEIIEAHNGAIYYTSEVKKGTTIKIVLPLN